MFDSARFRELLTARGLSQSELARRVGVSQASIYRLAAGDAYGSKHIHKIARELQTTAAYLMGETEDPSANFPTTNGISQQDRQILESLGALRGVERSLLIDIIASLSAKRHSQTFHQEAKKLFDLPSENALAAMFEAQLRVYGTLQGAELARALAKRLPRALARLQEVPLYEKSVSPTVGVEADKPLANGHPEPRRVRHR